MDMDGEEDDPFPVEDCLFEDTFTHESVFNLSGHELRIKQVFGANLGVAAPVWEASIHLSEFLVDHSVELQGKTVIELGAGAGLLGIFAARLGAVVTLTDLPVALAPLCSNVAANAPPAGWPCPPSVRPLPWGSQQQDFPSDWDLVLGADIVYLPESFPLLLQTLAQLCHGHTEALFCSRMRREHQTHQFYEDFLPSRFDVELVQRNELQNMNIYRARLRT